MSKEIKQRGLVITPGDNVCVTKITKDENPVKKEDQYTGVSARDIKEGEIMVVNKMGGGVLRFTSSPIVSVFTSHTILMVKTKDHMYVVEKLPD